MVAMGTVNKEVVWGREGRRGKFIVDMVRTLSNNPTSCLLRISASSTVCSYATNTITISIRSR